VLPTSPPPPINTAWNLISSCTFPECPPPPDRLATLLQHAVLAARTLIAHSCSEGERAALLGRIGASYGLGFALGPALGGLLSSISLTATAWAAAAGSILAMVIVKFGLPEGEA